MADPTKKCSKDELFDAMVKYKKKAQDAEAQRRAQQQGSEEVEMRVESLALQVSLYKEKEREIQADCDRERQEKEMAQVVAESLRTEHASLAAKLTQAEATVATLQRENATMSQALTQAPTDTEDIALERIDSGADANQLAASLREARALASEYKARIEDLQRSHEAFVEQSRLETEAEADRKVRAAEEALRGSRTTWEEERAVIVKAHMQKMDELQAMYNELKAGVETSQAWQFKEREVVALKDELAALRCEYNAACDRTLEVRKHQAEVGKRDELVAQLRDQVMVLETDLADTRDLCIRALRQTATAAPAADPHAVIQHPNDTVSVASSGSLSGSLTPPTSPREKPDLFDLLHSKSRTKTLHKDAKKELTKYKTKVLAQEQARQRNVDQVESYRADQLHALLTENEALRRAVDKTESCETSEEMLRVRQLHHRERDAWDEERTELHEQLKQSQASTAVQALTAEIKQIQAKLQKAEARCAALESDVTAHKAARVEAEDQGRVALAKVGGLQQRLQDLSAKESVFLDRMKEMEALTAVSLDLKAKHHQAEARAAALQAEVDSLRAVRHTPPHALPPAAMSTAQPSAAAAPVPASSPEIPAPTASAVTREQLELERRNKLAAMRERFRKVRSD